MPLKSDRSLVLPCILQSSQDKATVMPQEEGKWKLGAGRGRWELDSD